MGSVKRLARGAPLVVLICAVALCCVAPALALEPAGAGWYWQSPQPQGRWLEGVAMVDVHIWAVGAQGTILHTGDGGSSWSGQNAPTTEPLHAVAFTDAQHGCAVGGWETDPFTQVGVRSSVILHTADGGGTWTAAVQPSGWALADVVFIDSQIGIAVGQHGTILRTTDGGLTWEARSSGTTEDFGCVAFTDGQHGYALASGSLVARTTDGGLTWSTARTRSVYWDWAQGLAADGSGALWTASGQPWDDESGLLRSSDGGRTWVSVKTDVAAGLWDVAASGACICAVGGVVTSSADVVENTGIAVSHDGGSSWTFHLLGEGVLAGAVAVGGSGDLCVAGSGLVVSRDEGASWSGTGFDPPGVGSLDFVSATEGWSTGGDAWQRIAPLGSSPAGSILHTSDGATWQEQYSSSRAHLVDIDFADASSGWAVGANGVIRHTSDGGATWRAQALGKGSYFGRVEAPGPQDAWVLGRLRTRGARSAFLRTTDGGATWKTVKPPASFWPMTMRFLTGREGWTAGWGREDAEVAHTMDGGATWTRARLQGVAGLLPFALDFVDGSHGWLVGMRLSDSSSQVLRTEDGGSTWSAAGGQLQEAITDVDFVDTRHGWIAGENVWSTDDGGETWTRRMEGTGHGSSVAAADATHVWVAAAGYGIISTVDASGDTAPPTTASLGDRGWLRRPSRIGLSANDAGGSGTVATEYRLNGGAWLPYLTPLDFAAAADHSDDGRHLVEYRSEDAAGLVESIQRCRVDVDTIRPVIRLRPSTVGRDGVLRLHGRIDDASCPSVEEFELRFSDLRGRLLTTGEYSGFRLPANRWFTFIDRGVQIYDGRPGTYRVTLYAMDRAGNKPAKVDSATLVVKRRPKGKGEPVVRSFILTPGESSAARVTVAGAPGSRFAGDAMPAWLPRRVGEALLRVARKD